MNNTVGRTADPAEYPQRKHYRTGAGRTWNHEHTPAFTLQARFPADPAAVPGFSSDDRDLQQELAALPHE